MEAARCSLEGASRKNVCASHSESAVLSVKRKQAHGEDPSSTALCRIRLADSVTGLINLGSGTDCMVGDKAKKCRTI